jgi:predicted nuclease with TOPRIM domain
MPAAQAYSIDELTERLNECIATYQTINRKFEDARESKEIKHQELAAATQTYENIANKMDGKTSERDALLEKINVEQSEWQQLQQQLSRLSKKSIQLDEDIQKYQEKLNILTKNQPKVIENVRSLNV